MLDDSFRDKNQGLNPPSPPLHSNCFASTSCSNTFEIYFVSTRNRTVDKVTLIVREATREEKQLDFGFLLNSLDPPPLYLWTCSRTFFNQPHMNRQMFLKKFGFGSPPPFSWKISKLLLKRFLIRFGFASPPSL